MEGYTSDDPQHQRVLLTQALQLARNVSDLDLEITGAVRPGAHAGNPRRVPVGWSCSTKRWLTLGGECQRLETVVWASCSILAACSVAGDQKRAAQWCGAADRFAQKYGCPFLQARCRSHYGLVLVAHGVGIRPIEFRHALAMSADCGREPRSRRSPDLRTAVARGWWTDRGNAHPGRGPAECRGRDSGSLPLWAIRTVPSRFCRPGWPRWRVKRRNSDRGRRPGDTYLAHGDVVMAAAITQALRGRVRRTGVPRPPP